MFSRMRCVVVGKPESESQGVLEDPVGPVGAAGSTIVKSTKQNYARLKRLSYTQSHTLNPD